MGNDTLRDLLLQIEVLGRENLELKRRHQELSRSEQNLRREGLYYRRWLESDSVIRLLVDVTAEAIVDANPVACSFYGYALDALKQLRLSDLQITLPSLARIAQSEANGRHAVLQRHRLASGALRDVEVTFAPTDTGLQTETLETPRRHLYFLTVHDVTEGIREINSLRRSERHFHELVETAADPIYRTDSRGYFVYTNPAALRVLGYTRDELRDLHFTDLLRPDHIHTVHTFYITQVLRRMPNTYYEFPIITRDRREVWIGQNVQLIRDRHRLLGFQAVARDITDRKRAEQPLADHITLLYRRNRRLKARLDRLQRAKDTLEDQALTDYLTGLHNHRAFQESLEQTFAYARRTQTPLSLLLIDLDSFKQVNDTRGHPAGDAILARLGALLQERVRSTDIVARYGGEEFAVILPRTDQNGAIAQAERFRVQVEQAFLDDGHLTASFGVASLTPDTTDRHQLILQADAALYAAKQAGRNCVRHYAHLSADTRDTVLAVVTNRNSIPEDQHP
jgi:diguanylate cyclase (GGDEF)-like protein/PAS domain S-box-containing protein